MSNLEYLERPERQKLEGGRGKKRSYIELFYIPETQATKIKSKYQGGVISLYVSRKASIV